MNIEIEFMNGIALIKDSTDESVIIPEEDYVPLALALLKEAGAEVIEAYDGQEFKMPAGIVVIMPKVRK